MPRTAPTYSIQPYDEALPYLEKNGASEETCRSICEFFIANQRPNMAVDFTFVDIGRDAEQYLVEYQYGHSGILASFEVNTSQKIVFYLLEVD